MTKERWSRLVINENLAMELTQNVKRWIDVKPTTFASENYSFFEIAVAPVSGLTSQQVVMTIDFSMRNVTANFEDKLTTMEIEFYADVTGWEQPRLDFVDHKEYKDGNHKRVAIIQTKDDTQNNNYRIRLRWNNYKSGEVCINYVKLEQGNESTLYVPHKDLLTTEQQNLLKYGEYEQIQSF